MIYLQKLLPYLFYPITLVYVLLILAWFKKTKWPILIAFVTLIITSLPMTAYILTSTLENGQTRLESQDVASADTIVVLSGFLSRINTKQGSMLEWGNASRFFSGIELFKLHKANTIIFTNEKLPWMQVTQSTGQFLSNYAMQLGIKNENILITRDVNTTEDEAKAVKELANKHNIKSVILITSAFHMPRAQLQFEKQGFRVTPYPVDFLVNSDALTPMDFLPSASAFAMTEFTIREYLARTYYKFKSFLTN